MKYKTEAPSVVTHREVYRPVEPVKTVTTPIDKKVVVIKKHALSDDELVSLFSHNHFEALQQATGVDFSSMNLADAEYVLVQCSRSKREAVTRCRNCDSILKTSYKANDITVSPPTEHRIKANERITLVMSTPSCLAMNSYVPGTESAVELAKDHIKYIEVQNSVMNIDDVDDLISKLPFSVINKLVSFINQQQSIQTDITIECACGHVDEAVLYGLYDHIVRGYHG